MHRAVLATAGLACLAAGVGPAFAAAEAPATAGRAAGTSISFALPDGGSEVLDLVAVQGSNGSVLTIDAQRCGTSGSCDTEYSSPLPASALTVDPTNPAARLATTLSGVPLTITWRPGSGTAPGLAGEAGSFGGDGVDNSGASYAGQLADVSVKYGDSKCSGGGGVGDGAAVDTGAVTGTEPVGSVSALRIPDGATLTCTG